LVASSGASHIPAVRSGLPLSSWNSADVPSYLAGGLLRISDVDTRRRLRSADTAILVVPSTRRSTLGDRAFPVASARAWNSLPSSVRNAPSLTTFRRELKTVLFFDYRLTMTIGDSDCTAQYNLSARDYRLSALPSFFVFFCLILYGAPAMSLT